ncbi:hypothetical protein ACWGLF_10060 [Streptomyces puniciscabiei]
MATGPIHQWARVGAARAERAEGWSVARSGAGKRARRSGAQPGLDGGESIKAVSEYLGHSNAALTLRIYAHLMPSSQERTWTPIATVYAKAQRPV